MNKEAVIPEGVKKSYLKVNKKFALLSTSLPPSPTGQALMLFRLLEDIDPNNYCLFSKENYSSGDFKGFSDYLPAKYICIGVKRRNVEKKLLKQVPLLISIFIERIFTLFKVLKDQKCKVLVTCSGDIFDMVIGYLACLLSGDKFIAYIFDDYVYQQKSKNKRLLAKFLSSIIIHNAAAVIVPNDFLQIEYKNRYKINPVVINNPADKINHEERIWPSIPGEISIVYAGAVYEAHYDAFKNLLEAIRIINRKDIKLKIYTPHKEEEFLLNQITGPVEIFPFTSSNEIQEIQCSADILFLPLAFNSPYPEVIRTSSPGKFGELLASGRPLLIHAPTDSFISWYGKTQNLGQVVDKLDPHILADAILQIINKPELRQEWRKNGLNVAEKYFRKEVSQKKFFDLIFTLN